MYILAINIEDLFRLKFNYRGLENAYSRLTTALDKKDDIDIYISSNELILWAMNIEFWLSKNDSVYQKDKIMETPGVGVGEFKSLKFIFNILKHDMDFIQTHNKNTDILIPFDSNYHVGKGEVYWKKVLTPNPTKPENVSQEKNYQKYLAEKDMNQTVLAAVTYIRSRVRDMNTNT